MQGKSQPYELSKKFNFDIDETFRALKMIAWSFSSHHIEKPLNADYTLPVKSNWKVFKFIKIKGCVQHIASLFFKSKRQLLWNLEKMSFISLQKLFSFLRKSNFRILDVQISWCHQMSKHKTRNTFYWITWEVNKVCYWNLASLCLISKEKKLSKDSTKTATWKLVPGSFVFTKN